MLRDFIKENRKKKKKMQEFIKKNDLFQRHIKKIEKKFELPIMKLV
jgi:hypothetical protein